MSMWRRWLGGPRVAVSDRSPSRPRRLSSQNGAGDDPSSLSEREQSSHFYKELGEGDPFSDGLQPRRRSTIRRESNIDRAEVLRQKLEEKHREQQQRAQQREQEKDRKREKRKKHTKAKERSQWSIANSFKSIGGEESDDSDDSDDENALDDLDRNVAEAEREAEEMILHAQLQLQHASAKMQQTARREGHTDDEQENGATELDERVVDNASVKTKPAPHFAYRSLPLPSSGPLSSGNASSSSIPTQSLSIPALTFLSSKSDSSVASQPPPKLAAVLTTSVPSAAITATTTTTTTTTSNTSTTTSSSNVAAAVSPTAARSPVSPSRRAATTNEAASTRSQEGSRNSNSGSTGSSGGGQSSGSESEAAKERAKNKNVTRCERVDGNALNPFESTATPTHNPHTQSVWQRLFDGYFPLFTTTKRKLEREGFAPLQSIFDEDATNEHIFWSSYRDLESMLVEEASLFASSTSSPVPDNVAVIMHGRYRGFPVLNVLRNILHEHAQRTSLLGTHFVAWPLETKKFWMFFLDRTKYMGVFMFSFNLIATLALVALLYALNSLTRQSPHKHRDYEDFETFFPPAWRFGLVVHFGVWFVLSAICLSFFLAFIFYDRLRLGDSQVNLFTAWSIIGRIIVVGRLAYVAMIACNTWVFRSSSVSSSGVNDVVNALVQNVSAWHFDHVYTDDTQSSTTMSDNDQRAAEMCFGAFMMPPEAKIAFFFNMLVIMYDLFQVSIFCFFPSPWPWILRLTAIECTAAILRVTTCRYQFHAFFERDTIILAIILTLVVFYICSVCLASLSFERTMRNAFSNFLRQNVAAQEKRNMVNMLCDEIKLPAQQLLQTLSTLDAKPYQAITAPLSLSTHIHRAREISSTLSTLVDDMLLLTKVEEKRFAMHVDDKVCLYETVRDTALFLVHSLRLPLSPRDAFLCVNTTALDGTVLYTKRNALRVFLFHSLLALLALLCDDRLERLHTDLFDTLPRNTNGALLPLFSVFAQPVVYPTSIGGHVVQVVIAVNEQIVPLPTHKFHARPNGTFESCALVCRHLALACKSSWEVSVNQIQFFLDCRLSDTAIVSLSNALATTTENRGESESEGAVSKHSSEQTSLRSNVTRRSFMQFAAQSMHSSVSGKGRRKSVSFRKVRVNTALSDNASHSHTSSPTNSLARKLHTHKRHHTHTHTHREYTAHSHTHARRGAALLGDWRDSVVADGAAARALLSRACLYLPDSALESVFADILQRVLSYDPLPSLSQKESESERQRERESEDDDDNDDVVPFSHNTLSQRTHTPHNASHSDTHLTTAADIPLFSTMSLVDLKMYSVIFTQSVAVCCELHEKAYQGYIILCSERLAYLDQQDRQWFDLGLSLPCGESDIEEVVKLLTAIHLFRERESEKEREKERERERDRERLVAAIAQQAASHNAGTQRSAAVVTHKPSGSFIFTTQPLSQVPLVDPRLLTSPPHNVVRSRASSRSLSQSAAQSESESSSGSRSERKSDRERGRESASDSESASQHSHSNDAAVSVSDTTTPHTTSSHSSHNPAPLSKSPSDQCVSLGALSKSSSASLGSSRSSSASVVRDTSLNSVTNTTRDSFHDSSHNAISSHVTRNISFQGVREERETHTHAMLRRSSSSGASSSALSRGASRFISLSPRIVEEDSSDILQQDTSNLHYFELFEGLSRHTTLYDNVFDAVSVTIDFLSQSLSLCLSLCHSLFEACIVCLLMLFVHPVVRERRESYAKWRFLSPLGRAVHHTLYLEVFGICALIALVVLYDAHVTNLSNCVFMSAAVALYYARRVVYVWLLKQRGIRFTTWWIGCCLIILCIIVFNTMSEFYVLRMTSQGPVVDNLVGQTVRQQTTIEAFLRGRRGRMHGAVSLVFLVHLPVTLRFHMEFFPWPLSACVVSLLCVRCVLIVQLYLSHYVMREANNDTQLSLTTAPTHTDPHHVVNVEGLLLVFLVQSLIVFYTLSSVALQHFVEMSHVESFSTLYDLLLSKDLFDRFLSLGKTTLSHPLQEMLALQESLIESVQQEAFSQRLVVTRHMHSALCQLKQNVLVADEFLFHLSSAGDAQFFSRPLSVFFTAMRARLTRELVQSVCAHFVADRAELSIRVFVKTHASLLMVRVDEQLFRAMLTELCRVAVQRIEQFTRRQSIQSERRRRRRRERNRESETESDSERERERESSRFGDHEILIWIRASREDEDEHTERARGRERGAASPGIGRERRREVHTMLVTVFDTAFSASTPSHNDAYSHTRSARHTQTTQPSGTQRQRETASERESDNVVRALLSQQHVESYSLCDRFLRFFRSRERFSRGDVLAQSSQYHFFQQIGVPYLPCGESAQRLQACFASHAQRETLIEIDKESERFYRKYEASLSGVLDEINRSLCDSTAAATHTTLNTTLSLGTHTPAQREQQQELVEQLQTLETLTRQNKISRRVAGTAYILTTPYSKLASHFLRAVDVFEELGWECHVVSPGEIHEVESCLRAECVLFDVDFMINVAPAPVPRAAVAMSGAVRAVSSRGDSLKRSRTLSSFSGNNTTKLTASSSFSSSNSSLNAKFSSSSSAFESNQFIADAKDLIHYLRANGFVGVITVVYPSAQEILRGAGAMHGSSPALALQQKRQKLENIDVYAEAARADLHLNLPMTPSNVKEIVQLCEKNMFSRM